MALAARRGAWRRVELLSRRVVELVVRFNYANAATVLRLLLVVPIAWLVLVDRPVWALVVLILAVVTDAADGWLARRFGATIIGSWLDVAADRLLVVALVAVLWWTAAIPGWATLALVARELIIALGALITFVPKAPMAPLVVGKAHTAAAFVFIISAVAAQAGLVPTTAVSALAALVVVTAFFSLLAYALRLRA